ncbi:alpha/beta hydrolase [Mycolicibacterium sediminis]|uniref:Alpha/beta hydrolase n=1 Tax=Mycolicibacterium sediminis TaxID=1286180 RepID=A0A7I7QSD8_9MYCO|nr:alpha/beta fold hydrolase [Mycolicibacterium sediminis]BBY29224.1 alpha/beta hydrolase [Mycolicibacterium sediminis]
MLEVIDKGSVTDSHPVPLLFVHGAWHAAWCWDEHFLDFFADAGYRAVAPSLRGHGASTSPKPLRACSIDDFVSDVAEVADGMPTPPVIIGHSLGGLVVQKYLESHDAPAGVLLGSIPPRGSGGSAVRWLRRHPWHFAKLSLTGRSLPYVSTPKLARERFFSPDTPADVVDRYASRLQEASTRAGFECFAAARPDPARIGTPLLVLGAEHDGATSRGEVLATARAYGTQAEFLPGLGHDVMLEPGWLAAAERIDSWLTGRHL